MDIVREANRLAKEFLEQDIKKFELDLAVNGSKYVNTIEDFVDIFGHQNADKFHHLEFFEGGLDMERDEYIESIRSEKHSIIFDELDEFLNTKNIKLDRDSEEYQLLARRFVETKIDAIFHKIKIIRGGSFEYSNESDKNNKIQGTVKTNCFQKIEGLSWDRVSFNILSNEMIEIKTKDCKGKYTYHDLGFKDARKGDDHNKLWGVLLAFGNQGGSIDWKSCHQIKNTKQLKKDVQRIGQKLKDFMRIGDSPFNTYHKTRGYKTKFSFKDSRHS
jgi:hypothetical protein